MRAAGAPVYDPSRYRPGFSRDDITDHVRDVLDIVAELDPPDVLAPLVYQTVQQMAAAMQPIGAAVNGAVKL